MGQFKDATSAILAEIESCVDLLYGHILELQRNKSSAQLSTEHADEVNELRLKLESAARQLRQMGGDSLFTSDVHGVVPAPPEAREIPEEGTDPGRFLLLIVEDDEIQREHLKEFLTTFFDVHSARDVNEAVKLAASHPPDVIVSDMSMPDGDALGVLTAIRRSETGSNIPVLIVSGQRDTEAKVRAFEAGAFDYINKPVVPGELVARIRNALVRSEALRRERKLGEVDELTGLPNRRGLRRFIHVQLTAAQTLQRELSVVMVDSDNLKDVNDLLGHAAGDETIKTLGKTLDQCKRGSDCAARLGGDEFVVVMPSADELGAQKFISRVKAELKKPLIFGTNQIDVSASFGMATLGKQGWDETVESLLHRADAALYLEKAKRPKGRARSGSAAH